MMITKKYIRVWIVVLVVSVIVVIDVVGGIPVEEYVTDVVESVDGELVVVSDSNDAVCVDSVVVKGLVVVSSLGGVVVVVGVVVIVESLLDVLA